MAAAPDLSALEARIGHRFSAADLIEAALTHVSAAQGKRVSYQRLEFLGDRVLGVVVANMLYGAFPDADEGELSRRLADLVRKESCAEVALEWGVEAYVRVGESEKQNASVNRAILGDVCESIIGAVFLDGGFAPAQRVVTQAFEPRMRSPRRPLRDPKTTLQEWAQARGLPPPSYRETARTGPDHAPEFTISVEIAGFQQAEARGFAKRLAEQAAAAAFLTREKIVEPGDRKGAA
ncbi:Ribonuclease III [Methylocella silvestris BL2]|uniref:Ribonuclease 3 n=1 Tax=Methylocella silvestris (strain DSM 15510 / CIP 108128 / LMG 27833 / NCIMB 13906 / BL2) TaxID=395965 RepID=RNC_METSB|nr:ribonuclease III [Methylocella silvestris]B8EK13.1 RecName: Full=Ribonuclease 3; AltName: Full=Ribonuclease III; Short=RNase III [Methylocella silvestris BL2]ACK49960.1 Ribonuclease III [Methylocella silvestris BL2]